LELADEDEKVLYVYPSIYQITIISFITRYRVGEAFFHIPLSKAQAMLAKDQETLDNEIDKTQQQIDDCENTMKELKVELYAKFGKAINLDA